MAVKKIPPSLGNIIVRGQWTTIALVIIRVDLMKGQHMHYMCCGSHDSNMISTCHMILTTVLFIMPIIYIATLGTRNLLSRLQL